MLCSLLLSPSSAPSLQSSASVALATVLEPSKTRPLCFQHIRDTWTPVRNSTSRQRFNIGRSTMYWEIVFWSCRTYVSTSYRPATNISTAAVGIPNAPPYHAAVASPPTDGPPFDGNPPGFNQSGGSLPMSPSQTNLSPARPVFITSRRSGCLPLPDQDLGHPIPLPPDHPQI